MAFEQLGQSLDHLTRRSPIRSAVTALKVEQETKKHLPPWARMISFREGRLLIGTPSPAHSQEIFLQSRELKIKINEGLGGKVVEEIRYRIRDWESERRVNPATGPA